MANNGNKVGGVYQQSFKRKTTDSYNMNQSTNSQNTTFQDPKGLFLTKLNERLTLINTDLFAGKTSDAAHKMSITIQTFEIPNNDDYTEIQNLQDNWSPDIANTSPFRKGPWETPMAIADADAYKIWRVMWKFLNSTYFKGWNGGRPQESRPSQGTRPL